jgi:hypothetical protein
MSDTTDNPAPKNTIQLDQMALVGGLIALFQAAETMLGECRKYPNLNKFMGKVLLNRMQAEVERLNSWMEFSWQSAEADHVGFLAIDTRDILKVLASLEPETRTNMADPFRRVWAKMKADLGEETALADMEAAITQLRENRGLFAATQDDDTLRVTREGEQPKSDTEPNCVIFVRDAETKAFVADATIHIEMEDGQRDLIKKTDVDTLYERRYPTGVRIAFKGFKPGYTPSGTEKIFYADDPEQLVVTVWMKPAA